MNPAHARLLQLDVLRFLAVFLIIGRHFVVCPPEISPVLHSLTTVWFRVGWTGVDLFFVLSGFLVSGILFREHQKNESLDIKRFLIRRGFKIYPSFWLLIIMTTIVTAILKNGEVNRAGTVGELLFIQNYFAALWWHTWALAVEEQFYLGLSVLFLVLIWLNRENPFAGIPRIFLFLALSCLTMRYWAAVYNPENFARSINATHLMLDALFFGVFLSYLWHYKGLSESVFLQRRRKSIAVAGAALFIPAFIYDLNAQSVWLIVLGFTAFYLGGGLLLISFLKMDFSNSRFLKFVGKIGAYSYPIYLWNMPVFYWGENALMYLNGSFNWWLFAVIYFTGTFALGIGTAKLVEYPILRLRDKYYSAKKQKTYLVEKLEATEAT